MTEGALFLLSLLLVLVALGVSVPLFRTLLGLAAALLALGALWRALVLLRPRSPRRSSSERAQRSEEKVP